LGGQDAHPTRVLFKNSVQIVRFSAYEAYGLYFSAPVGSLIKADGSRIPLYYAEIKIIKGTNIYHVIPRTRHRGTNQ